MIDLTERGTPKLNTVHHCRAEALLSALDSGSIDLGLVSPPYDNLRAYNGFAWNFEYIAQQSYRVLKPGGVLVWVVGDAFVDGSETLTGMRQALYFVDHASFKMHDTMIYEVAGTGAKGSNLGYWQAFEYMFVLSKGRPKTTNLIYDKRNVTAGGMSKGRVTKADGSSNPTYAITESIGKRTNVWRYMTGFQFNGNTGHPAPFPEALAEDHILSWSNPGDVVLDYFGGSGTTAKMARKNGRDYLTCDISLEYCQLMQKRLDMPFTPMFAEMLA